MKMLKFLLLSICMVVSSTATQFEPGPQVLQQPNDSTFTGIYTGTYFQNYLETSSGHRVVRSSDGWYYYAELDGGGDFAPSDSVVTVNLPPAGSYQLDRSAAQKSTRDSLENEYDDMLDSIYTNYSSPLREETFKVGLMLVEFDSVKHYTFEAGHSPQDEDASRPYGYLTSDWENMLFSSGLSYSSFDINGTETDTRSPSGLEVYGSLRDYFLEQSNGEVEILTTSRVMNATDANGVPVWAELDSTKAWYDTQGLGGAIYDIRDELSLDDSLATHDPPGPYDRIFIIYAGNNVQDGGLNPIGPEPFMMGSELKFLQDATDPNSHGYMRGIGLYAHEFGHNVLGSGHPGGGDYKPYFYWVNMNLGNNNGPINRTGTCPAGIWPIKKLALDWYEAEIIDHDTLSFTVEYDYFSPNYYKFYSPSFPIQYYIVENRLKERFDALTPFATPPDSTHPGDVKGNAGGVLFWASSGIILIKPADDNYSANEDWDWYDSLKYTYAGDQWPLYQGQDFNYNTTPSTKYFPSSSDPHIAFQNITWNSADSTVTFDFYANAYTGSLSSIDTIDIDMTLYDEVTFTNNIYIMAGTTVRILPGTIINMATDKTIYVYGELNSTGTASDGIRFTSSSTDWWGIYVMAGGDLYSRYTRFDNMERGLRIETATSDADVRYCNFRDSDYGFYVRYNDDIDVRDNSFSNNTYSARFYYADCDVLNNDIDSSKYGIYAYYSDIDMDNNEIHFASGTSTARCGVFLSRSSASMDRNDISNSYSGIRIYNYSGPDLTSVREEEDDNDVNNYIHDNDLRGVYISSYSSPDFGVYASFGAPAIIEGGFNYFTGNEAQDIYNYTASPIYAQVNWWEADSPNNLGTVITSYQADVVLGTGPGNLPKGGSLEDLLTFYREARMYELDSLYDDAIAVYDSIIVHDTESLYRHVAMIGIERCYRSMETYFDFLGKMDEIQATYPKEQISTIAKYMKTGELARSGNLMAAIQGFEKCVDDFGEYDGMQEQEAWALFDVGQVAEIIEETQAGLGKAAQANKALLSQYPESEAAALLKDLIGGEDRKEKVVNLPTKFKLNHPYPNPFNPSTTISYELPKTAEVTITVYDILGCNVWSHEETAKPAGHYSLQWNGLNNNGKLAASGIYMISFSTPEFKDVKKAVLIR